jgi:hypothetical protein
MANDKLEINYPCLYPPREGIMGIWLLGVENFVSYLHRHGNRDHLIGIDVSTILELIYFPTIVV